MGSTAAARSIAISNTTTSHTNSNAASSASNTVETHMGNNIIIDSSSCWDGPHPGLAAGQASLGNRSVRRAPVGMVRLPVSLLAPERRVPRLPRAPGQGVGGGASALRADSSGQPHHSAVLLRSGIHGPACGAVCVMAGGWYAKHLCR